MKQEIVKITDFINNFDGELTVKLSGVYHKNKLIAKFKNGKSLILQNS